MIKIVEMLRQVPLQFFSFLLMKLYLRVEYNVNEYAVTGVMNTLRKFKAVSVFSVLA